MFLFTKGLILWIVETDWKMLFVDCRYNDYYNE